MKDKKTDNEFIEMPNEELKEFADFCSLFTEDEVEMFENCDITEENP